MPKRKPGRPRKNPLKDAPILILYWRGRAIDPVTIINDIVSRRKAQGESVTTAKKDIAEKLNVNISSLYDWLRRDSVFPRDPERLQTLLELHMQSTEHRGMGD